MTENRYCERMKNMIACKSYTAHEDVPGNKKIFIYELKRTKVDKVDNKENGMVFFHLS